MNETKEINKDKVITIIKETGCNRKSVVNSDSERIDFNLGEEYFFNNEGINELADKILNLLKESFIEEYKQKADLTEELGLDISECWVDAGDGGNNNDNIECALETFNKLKTLILNK